MEDFGILIACCQADYHLTKACCASIRYFLGNVPIAVIIDGNFSVKALEKTYGVTVINRSNIEDKFLRENSFGCYSKLIPFWKSPWKHFLYLDSDTIVWGNIIKYTKYFQDFDVIISRPCRKGYTVKEISYFFFDPQAIEKHFATFNWQKYQNDYFCAGVFFGKRDLFSLEEDKEILAFMTRYSTAIKMADQGCLNFLLFKLADEGRIRLKQEKEEIIQLTIPDYKNEVLVKRFPIVKDGPIYQNEDTIIHWCGINKPELRNAKVYSEPVNYFRQKFIYDSRDGRGLGAEILLQTEDLQRKISKRYRYYKNKLLRRFLNQKVVKN